MLLHTETKGVQPFLFVNGLRLSDLPGLWVLLLREKCFLGAQIKEVQVFPLYVLGDVIDRFPDGIEILQELMAMPNVKMLLGNHEYMMLMTPCPTKSLGTRSAPVADRKGRSMNPTCGLR